MPKTPDTHTPREGFQPRKTTDKRGGHIEPDNASPRFSPYREEFVDGITQGPPNPEIPSSRRQSGSHLENEMPNTQVEPIATRESGPSRTTENPLK